MRNFHPVFRQFLCKFNGLVNLASNFVGPPWLESKFIGKSAAQAFLSGFDRNDGPSAAYRSLTPPFCAGCNALCRSSKSAGGAEYRKNHYLGDLQE